MGTTTASPDGYRFSNGERRTPNAEYSLARTESPRLPCSAFGIRRSAFGVSGGRIEARFWRKELGGLHHYGTLHRDERHGLRGRVPGGLHPPAQGRARVRVDRD